MGGEQKKEKRGWFMREREREGGREGEGGRVDHLESRLNVCHLLYLLDIIKRNRPDRVCTLSSHESGVTPSLQARTKRRLAWLPLPEIPTKQCHRHRRIQNC
jgi:hypothetical protein